MLAEDQRCVIGMLDGFGLTYLEGTNLPVIKNKLIKEGLFKKVSGCYPSVTNVNNVGIATGSWPKDHGIIANSYFNRESGTPEYMNDKNLIKVDSVFIKGKKRNKKVAVLSSKKKSTELFGDSADIAITAENPPKDLVEAIGEPAHIYSSEVNDWLWQAAIYLLKKDKSIDLIYVHITDYPMHRWAPEEIGSQLHLQKMDARLGEITECAPDAAILLTADHSMNKKTRCWNLAKVCENRGIPLLFALSPERDYYIKHHKNYTGCSWIWLKDPEDKEPVREIIKSLDGVDEVYDSKYIADKYKTSIHHIGDLVVEGDKNTMFGEADEEYETLDEGYRAHGSLHEMELPMIMYNTNLEIDKFNELTHNKDLTIHLWDK